MADLMPCRPMIAAYRRLDLHFACDRHIAGDDRPSRAEAASAPSIGFAVPSMAHAIDKPLRSSYMARCQP